MFVCLKSYHFFSFFVKIYSYRKLMIKIQHMYVHQKHLGCIFELKSPIPSKCLTYSASGNFSNEYVYKYVIQVTFSASTYSISLQFYDEILSCLIENWMKNHLVSVNICNIVNI